MQRWRRRCGDKRTDLGGNARIRGPLSSVTINVVNVSVEEVEKDPHAYLHRVLEGETVVVFEKDRPVAEMRPLAERAGKRPIGLAKGEFVVPDDFNDPLPEDVLELFEGD